MVNPTRERTLDALDSASQHDAAERVAALGTILGIWAHPDDEVYLSAIVMRLALENGQRVVCLTATAGEHGTDDPVKWPPAALRAQRRRELHDSLAVLATGQTRTIEHHWLDHEDGRCADANPEQTLDQVSRFIESVGPDTILTFGADGLTGHPDHRAVAHWVSAALEGRPDIVRLDAVVARSWIDQFEPADDIEAYFDDGYPRLVDDATVAVSITATDDLWIVKDAALRSHTTQTTPVVEQLGPRLWRAFSNTETFAVHLPATFPTNHHHESDPPT